MHPLVRRKSLSARGLPSAALVWLSAVLAAGCSSFAGEPLPSPSQKAPAVSDPRGSLGMTLTLPGGETINTITWKLTGPGGAPTVVQQGTVNVQNSLTVSFLVSGLAPASGYTIALSGQSTDGQVLCAGSATFAIASRMTTSVTDLLQCTPAMPEAGSVAVAGQLFDCAAVAALTALPSEATVGNAVALAATATAVNPGGVTYAWSSPSGSFSAPTAASTNFTCTASGPVTVTLTVGDGPVPDGGACPASTSAATVQILCDTAAGAPDAGGG